MPDGGDVIYTGLIYDIKNMILIYCILILIHVHLY